MSHAIITGASSGIGAALARRFAAAGFDLTLVARRAELLEALAAELPTRAHCVARDLAEGDPTDWIAAAEATLGPVDVLVNNAGVQVIGATASIDPIAAQRSVQLNLVAPLLLQQAVLGSMIARGAGTVVNIASMAALAPTPGMTWYNATKAGLAGASEALRGELLGTGVNVVTVYPGLILDTDMGRDGMESYTRSWMLQAQPTATSPQLAEQVWRAVDRRSARVIYPRMNALARWFPGPTRLLMDRFTPGLA